MAASLPLGGRDTSPTAGGSMVPPYDESPPAAGSRPSARTSSDEAAPDALGDGRDPIADLELAVAVFEMLLDGRRADDQRVGDPLRTAPMRRELQDLELARRQAGTVAARRRHLARGDQMVATDEVAR